MTQNNAGILKTSESSFIEVDDGCGGVRCSVSFGLTPVIYYITLSLMELKISHGAAKHFLNLLQVHISLPDTPSNRKALLVTLFVWI